MKFVKDKLFNNSETGGKVRKKSKQFSIIDNGLTVDGDLICRGDLIIRGAVRGRVVGESIVISKEGSLQSKTKATSITVGGKFEGEAVINGILTVLSTGTCSGKIRCRDLIVEAGGSLNAEVTCTANLEKVQIPALSKKQETETAGSAASAASTA